MKFGLIGVKQIKLDVIWKHKTLLKSMARPTTNATFPTDNGRSVSPLVRSAKFKNTAIRQTRFARTKGYVTLN